jgi:hypothetical protein
LGWGYAGYPARETEERRSMDRLLIPVAACVVLATVAFMAAVMLLDFPTVVVCEKGTKLEKVEVSSTRKHGYFDERRVGSCVLYFHHSRQPGVDYGPFAGD